MNVLRDTHRALVPGGCLLDFHPTYPPWGKVVVDGEERGEFEEPGFPEALRETEGGMEEVVRLGLFELAARRTHDITEHYEDIEDLTDCWEDLPPDIERLARDATERVDIIYKVVFNLYRAR